MHNFPLNGICTINNCSYEHFEQRLNEIINMSSKEYFSRMDKDRKYIMEYKTIESINKEIDIELKSSFK